MKESTLAESTLSSPDIHLYIRRSSICTNKANKGMRWILEGGERERENRGRAASWIGNWGKMNSLNTTILSQFVHPTKIWMKQRQWDSLRCCCSWCLKGRAGGRAGGTFIPISFGKCCTEKKRWLDREGRMHCNWLVVGYNYYRDAERGADGVVPLLQLRKGSSPQPRTVFEKGIRSG